MLTINPRLKHLLLVLIAQVGCFAIGLWGHGQFVVSSVNRAAMDAIWQQLIRQAYAPQGQTHVTVVDANWHVQPITNSSRSAPDTPLDWTPVEDETAGSPLVRGVIQIDGEQHIAVARRRERGGYTVLHVPSTAITLTAGELSGTMRIAGAITLLWVSAMLGLVVYLIVTRLYDEQARKRSQLEAVALGQIQTLQRTRDGIVFGLAKLAEFRDQETGHHLERISTFAERLASALLRRQRFHDLVTPDFVRMIGVSAVLHDIGKVGVPDSILLKPGPLTPDERELMREHTLIGGHCIAEIERRLGSSNFLRMAGEIALSHHERWDGTGYPHAVSGDEIPLAARIVAVVDVYDALSSHRVYKDPMPHEDCVEVIRSEAGRHFDPLLVEVFLEIETELRDISRKYCAEESRPLPPPELLPRRSMARENEELVVAGAVPDDGLWLAPMGI